MLVLTNGSDRVAMLKQWFDDVMHGVVRVDGLPPAQIPKGRFKGSNTTEGRFKTTNTAESRFKGINTAEGRFKGTNTQVSQLIKEIKEI